MEKTIDFEHKTNGNKACFNASQKIKHYQIDPKKEHFKKAQVLTRVFHGGGINFSRMGIKRL